MYLQKFLLDLSVEVSKSRPVSKYSESRNIQTVEQKVIL